MIVTKRDKYIVECLVRFGPATYDQLAHALHVSTTALRQRMPRLARQGLLHRTTNLGEVALWAATPAGALLTGQPINTLATHSPDNARTRLLTSLALNAIAAGRSVQTRAEMERTARTAALAEALRTGDRIGTTNVVAPDLIVIDAGGGRTTVHLIPATPRPPRVWIDLLRDHLSAGSPGVCVWTDDHSIVETVRAAARVVHYPDCRVCRLP